MADDRTMGLDPVPSLSAVPPKGEADSTHNWVETMRWQTKWRTLPAGITPNMLILTAFPIDGSGHTGRQIRHHSFARRSPSRTGILHHHPRPTKHYERRVSIPN